jgi:hypothetical protein
MPNDSYELEYEGDGIRSLGTFQFGGRVTVSFQNGTEIHELWVKNVRVAEYRRPDGDTQGESISYIVGRRKVGRGNLLAGILLRLGQLESKRG